MWGRRRRGAVPGGGRSAEELRARRREREAALRKARRQEQLVSKRLLREETAEEGGQDGAESVPGPLSEDEVLQLLRGVQRGSEDRKSSLGRLRWALQNKETQQKFVRLDGSIRTLIGLFTSSLADMQMEAARCLHELSHSSDPAVAEACLPVTSYLLTYLSGHSVEFTVAAGCSSVLPRLISDREILLPQPRTQGFAPFAMGCSSSAPSSVWGSRDCRLWQLDSIIRDAWGGLLTRAGPGQEELCLYTLGNLVVESEAVRKQLLPQGIIPVLASCIQSPHEAVLEGLGYVLSQLLQAKEAPTEIVPLVLDSVLPQHMLRLVCSGLKAGTGAAVEFAWCLHYIVCSHTANAVLLSLGALPALTSLLLDMASEIPQDAPEGLELLVCPVLRCLSNLLAEETGCEGQIQDERLLIALFLILQSFFQQHPFIVQECLWLLNNLTADEPFFCSALLSLDLLPALLQLLPCSQMAGVLVLTVLCNVAEKGPAYCQQLHHQPALPLLLPALALPDPEVVGQCLELLHLLFLHCPEAAADFVRQGGHRALEQHQSTPELQERVRALLDMVGQPLGASTFSSCHAALSAFS
ncbi:transmembrane and coiled-coil domain-containing protein 6 isoform X2 [Chroicocephalus ridibundus]|uniref:transmembrane and coiled-coil domain-containing protein 6 isoform X2 n=1 Tax=Chroicocephalus ridibundus TaxID=1192867 RepID=UPI002FDCD66D